MPKITQLSLAEINRAFSHVDELKKQIGLLNDQLSAVKHQVKQLDFVHAPVTTNNVKFTWTGSTSTISWTAGSIADKQGVNVPVSSGSIAGLTANQYYWMAWNKVHQVMTAQLSADTLLVNPGNLVICKIFTGTAGQTGTAGGGGSSSNKSDLSGFQYKLF